VRASHRHAKLTATSGGALLQLTALDAHRYPFLACTDGCHGQAIRPGSAGHAGSGFLRTLSVPGHDFTRLVVPAHGHMADKQDRKAGDPRYIRRSGYIYTNQSNRSVKPSAQPTQVRTLHLPPHKTPGQARCALSQRAVLRHMRRSGSVGGRVWCFPWSGDFRPGAQFMDVARVVEEWLDGRPSRVGGLRRFTALAQWRGDCPGGAGWSGCGTASG
jgi:hypothetical protein